MMRHQSESFYKALYKTPKPQKFTILFTWSVKKYSLFHPVLTPIFLTRTVAGNTSGVFVSKDTVKALFIFQRHLIQHSASC